MKKGFTLIELLVVVLIIGILAAIALPMYNKAVLRSRFAALMPIVKAMNDSNEAYYLEHNSYASNPQDLPVQGQLEYPTGTQLEFGPNMDYAYVLASNPDARNNYIMYQKHSENYPGEIHCEALNDDEIAQSICASYGDNNIGTTLTEGYTTYVVQGTGAGMPAGADDGSLSCNKAISMGFSCSMTENEDGTKTKNICYESLGVTVCRIRTYNENGSYTSVTCESNGSNGENVCTGNWRSSTYDSDGNLTNTRFCGTVASDGSCSLYSSGHNYKYDANGNMLSDYNCWTFTAAGSCSQWSSYGDNYEYTYDANGNMTVKRSCKTVAANESCSAYYSYGNIDTYDENGNKVSSRSCATIGTNGLCSTYNSYNNYDYTYDANGNVTSQRNCSTIGSDGSCSAYASTENFNYTYDDNGNRTSVRNCGSVANDGNCTAYSGWGSVGTDYTYDENGHMTSQRNCASATSDGNCSAYGATWGSAGFDYTYDTNGNMTSQRNCSTVAVDGSCSAYGSATYYTYDSNGNKTSARVCNSVSSDGSCSAYSSGIYYMYDDDGKPLTVEQTCSGANINTVTGECIAYDNIAISNH